MKTSDSAKLEAANLADMTARSDAPRSAVTRFLAWAQSGPGLTLIALSGFWLLLFDALRGEWEINAQYNFGWVVPFLGAALVWRRWSGRPPSTPPRFAWPVAAFAGLLAVLALPLRLILEANPEWRLAYWVHAFQVVGLSLCLLYQVGGWPWVRHFAFPVCFLLIAVPWPMEFEQGIIQSLMRFVAGATVEFVGWLGIPAMQHGNLVEIGNGMVGIDEACSGVRSLQSGLMIALFLGEQYLFSAARRIGLLLSSIALVVVANMGRTTFLVWAAAERGFHQMEAWHDAAGNVVMWVVLPGLFALAWLLRPKTTMGAEAVASVSFPTIRLPRWVGIGALAWIAFSLVASEAWYRTHERQLVANTPWSVAWPVEAFNFKESAVPENALAILRCSNSKTASWQDDHGNDWSAFLLRWDAGENSAQLAKGHRPEICLTAAGARLLDDLGMASVSLKDVQLNFHHQTFEGGTQLMHVFYCIWADKVSPSELNLKEDGSRSSRFDAVLAGKRHLGQQVLEVVITGPESMEAARQLLEQQLATLIERL